MTQKNFIDINGLTTQTRDEITADLIAQFQAIYGADISVEANSPDGQMIGIFTQAKLDMLDTIIQVYNSFSPERATGIPLDQRCAINGVVRRGATYTRVPITVVTDRVVVLPGVDTSTTPFTISDLSGNEFQLETTTTASSGSNILTFQAKTAGAITTALNTITTMSTIMLGVVSVNNPTSNLQNGIDEESDVELRIRRQASVALASTGYLSGLIGALKAIDTVLDAVVFENTTGVTDSNLIPGHSIWAIVDAPVTDDLKAAVAEAIYAKRNAGCGMKGDIDEDVTQADGTPFTVSFDSPIDLKLYIKMTLESMNPLHAPDESYLTTEIAKLTYQINENADFTAISALVKTLDPLVVVTAGGVAGPAPWDATVSYSPTELVTVTSGATTTVYKCKLASLNNQPPNGSYWDVYTLQIGDYDSYITTPTVQGRWQVSSDRITITVV